LVKKFADKDYPCLCSYANIYECDDNEVIAEMQENVEKLNARDLRVCSDVRNKVLSFFSSKRQ